MSNAEGFNGSAAQDPAAASPLDDASSASPSAGGGPGANAQAGADDASDVTALLRKAEQDAGEMREAYLRARADADNVRRQSQLEVSKAHKYGIEKFAELLLPVKDALEQALATQNTSPESLREGVELTLRQLNAAFEKSQLTVIDPVGEKFDPHFHQAMAMVDSDQPANTVVNVMQKGYRLNDRVLRPALVAVAKGDG